MATNQKRLKVTELDFDAIKSNLKTFLRSQSEFKDYDFEGSGMNILLDTLAYNTHYLAFNGNMLANEMFLDSSSLRSSVVSHAKTLGYDVSSPRAPFAILTVNLATTDASKTISAGTAFTTEINNQTYKFVTINDVSRTNIGNAVIFNDLYVYEGTFVTSNFTVDSDNVDQKFLLADARADTTTLTVKVQNSATDTTTTTYARATDITTLESTSEVYYLQETDAGKFQVYFGDGVVSKGLSDGNIVILEYVVTNKGEANGAFSFSSPSSIDGVTNISITTIAGAVGGSEGESISSIKLNAPLNYASQGRVVTPDDYKVYVRKLFANTQAVSVWGGEDGSYDTSTGVSSTPEYGKVFISVKSTTGQNLTTSQKNTLIKNLSPYKVASVTPVIVDPEVTYLILTTNFQYDSSKTTLNKSDLEASVRTVVSNYNDSLNDFDKVFRYSQLTGNIDDADISILSNITTVIIGQLFTPIIGTSSSYTINFSNPLYNPHSGHNASDGGIIASTGFYLGGTTEYFFDDDGAGNLRIYSLVDAARVYFDSEAGTVDYSDGTVKINPLSITNMSNVDGLVLGKIRVTAIPNSNDIIPVRNQLLEIDLTNTTVVGSVDATATTGKGYTVTTTGTTTTTTVSTPSSTPTSSGY